MPILAGRALGLGAVALAHTILFWIPTHTLTFSMTYEKDYERAGAPTFPSIYGLAVTRTMISIDSVLAAFTIIAAGYGIGMSWEFLRLLGLLSAGLLLLAFDSSFYPSKRINAGLFKYASIYMLAAMILVVLELM